MVAPVKTKQQHQHNSMKLQQKLSKDQGIWWNKRNEEEKHEGRKGEVWTR
jgi:hypothetical protein